MLKRLFTALLALGLLTACTPATPSETQAAPTSASAQAQPKALEPFDIILDWYPNAVHSFLYTAIEKGYYAEEGLEVRIHTPSNPTDGITLVAGGKADMGIYYPHDVIAAIAEDHIPIKMVGALVQDSISVIVSKKDRNIQSPDDLLNKKVGFFSTPLADLMLASLTKKDGTPVGQLQTVDVGFDLLAALTTDRVDACVGALVNHEVPVLEEEGLAINYFYPVDYGIPNYSELVLVASDEAIAQHPAKLEAFLRASLKGFMDVKADPEQALKTLLAHQNEADFPLSETVERKSLSILLPVMDKEGHPFLSQNRAYAQAGIDWLTKLGKITRPLTVDEVLVDLPYRAQ